MKKINFKKIFSAKNAIFSLLIFGAVFLVGHFAFAGTGIGEALGNVVGSIIALFIRAISSILILLVNVMMSVMAYSDFINAPAVSKGWVVVRDLCNMFFVVVLLIIAFATILGKEEYGAKKFLPKLIMAAVLINFSKLICGLMIDVSSVVMLTFVNAFSAIGAGNILDMLGISEVTQISVSNDSNVVTFSMIVSSYIFGLIYVVLATVVIAAMLGMLVVRLVMIWILVVLSPFAFFLEAVPGAGKYSSQWWSRWTSNLLVGPIIAFFLWLSFAALQSGNSVLSTNESDDLAANNADLEDVAGLGSEAGTTSSMAKFVIAIGMLLGGMQIAQSVGYEAGGAMGKIFGKGKGMATAAGIGALTAGGKAIGRGARNATLTGVGKLANRFGEKDLVTGKRPETKLGKFAFQWRDDLIDSRKKEKVASREKFLKKIGIGEKSAEVGKDILNTDIMQKAGRAGRGALNYATSGALIGAGFAGPVGSVGGALLGSLYGTVFGSAAGYTSQKKYEKAKKDIKDYEQKNSLGVSQESEDKIHVDSIKNQKAAAKAAGKKFNIKKDITNDERDALKRAKQNEKNKKIIAGKDFLGATTSGPIAYERTGKAFDNMTKKKKAAQDWVKIAANDKDMLKNISKPSEIYSSAGLSEIWKKRFEELNTTNADSVTAIDNMIDEINDGTTVSDKKKEAMAKALSAFKKKDGKVDPATLGRLENALSSQGFVADSYTNIVSTQYKKLGTGVEEVKDGTGSLQYDAFAKNAAKKPTDRNLKKDIMGVSFEKINEKAESLGVDYKIDAAEGVNQKADGEQLKKLSTVMSSLIDDEIAALEKIGADINSQKISQLNTAKARLQSGDLSGLSLKNTDVIYKGETDSERRRNEYNATQHETMHQYGAKDEDVVDSAANALQEAKLVGRIPKSDQQSGGKSYEEVLGKMIADLEQKGSSKEDINEAVASQISQWTPSNAQRVIETENGERETVKDVVVSTKDEIVDDEEISRLTEVISKMSDSLERPINISKSDDKNNEMNLSVSAVNFFYKMFDGVKKTIRKDDMLITDKLKPLSAMVISESRKTNNINDVL